MTTYHVAKTGSDKNPGTQAAPFLTINAAARAARAGDTVIVHEGVYREWVKPREGGLSNTRRITYAAAQGEKVAIKGSEHIQGWENVSGTVWKVKIANTVFGDFNPYAETVSGDWLLEPFMRDKPGSGNVETGNPGTVPESQNASEGRQASEGRFAHLGCVYINGMALYEANSPDDVYNPEIRETIKDHWTQEIVPVKDPGQTIYLWYAEVDSDWTVITANFHGADPNKELTEINVRKCVFYPAHPGVDYITVRGFEMAQAACPWTPPTADQPGLIGAYWSRGWIIENNIIHDAKCSGVSIGKEASTGHNDRTNRKDKPGYSYQLEAVFKALKIGWSKEKIGSHIIRGNTIYDCGQNGIVGHLGCIFSEIYDNHIYNIAIRREFYGHEIAGIKLHAPIDVTIRNNHIHDCSLGIWMDWQMQGTRISSNLLHSNNRDLFVEVSHGPSVIDHNILGSKNSLYIDAQGMAYVRNLIGGKVFLFYSNDRATPYHTAHSTDVKGFYPIYGGDDRFYQNIFIGEDTDYPDDFKTHHVSGLCGTAHFGGRPVSLQEYIGIIDAQQPCDHWEFAQAKQPVYIAGNVYLNKAKAFDKETDKLDCPGFDAGFSVECKDCKVFLNITLPEGFDNFTRDVHTTASLGRVRVADAEYENPDGSSLVLDTDYFGAVTAAGGKTVAGPINTLKTGANRVELADCQT